MTAKQRKIAVLVNKGELDIGYLINTGLSKEEAQTLVETIKEKMVQKELNAMSDEYK